MSIKFDLTICTVNYKNKELVKENLNYISRKINELINVYYIIVDNSGEIQVNDFKFPKTTLLKGRAVTHDDYPSSIKKPLIGSLHHALALNQAIKNVRTRWLLIIDPDFIFVNPLKIHDFLNDMHLNKIVIAGVPWHPKWFYNYRYFPAPHCIFFDLDSLEKDNLDFRPDYSYKEPRRAPILLRILNKIPWVKNCADTMLRSNIGMGGDTGSRNYNYFIKNLSPNQIKVIQVGINSSNQIFQAIESTNLEHSHRLLKFRHVFAKILELFLPDSWCFIPKKNVISPKTFASFGLPDFNTLGWEEFLWDDRPWGIHFRSFPKRKLMLKEHDVFLEAQKAISFFTSKYHLAPPKNN
jgi:hypothetical protein